MHKLNKKIVLITITGLIAFFICLMSYQLIVRNCLWWECAPVRDFTLYDLNLPDELFPPNAQVYGLQYDRGTPAMESAATTNYWDGGLAIYSVMRFATFDQATKQFEYDANNNIFTRGLGSSESYSELLEFDSQIADSSQVKCGYVTEDLRCIFIARYEEYTIFFSGSIGEEEMTKTDFFEVMTYIENKMKDLLIKRQSK
jgi:hypothetical protein